MINVPACHENLKQHNGQVKWCNKTDTKHLLTKWMNKDGGFPLPPFYSHLHAHSHMQIWATKKPLWSHNGNLITGAWTHPLLSWLGCGRVRQWLRNECQRDLGSSGCYWLKDVFHMIPTWIKMLLNGCTVVVTFFLFLFIVVFRTWWHDSTTALTGKIYWAGKLYVIFPVV